MPLTPEQKALIAQARAELAREEAEEKAAEAKARAARAKPAAPKPAAVPALAPAPAPVVQALDADRFGESEAYDTSLLTRLEQEEQARAAMESEPLTPREPFTRAELPLRFEPPQQKTLQQRRKEVQPEVERILRVEENEGIFQSQASKIYREPEDVEDAINRLRENRRRELESELLNVSKTSLTAPIIPPLRPSRIVTRLVEPSIETERFVESVERVDEAGQPYIAEEVRDIDIASERERRRAGQPGGRTERVYIDPQTGEARKPTGLEEIIEGFAKQQVLNEEQVKAIAEAYASGQRDRPIVKNLMSRREAEGRGYLESELAAAMRGFGQLVSAAVTEAYFRGLGYEVDEQGEPIDKSDFGYKLDQYFKENQRKTGFVKPIGIAPQTRREQGNVAQTAFDPYGVRGAAPAGSSLAEIYGRQIGTGRSFSDELLSSPDTMAALKDAFGDYAPIAAIGTGMALDIGTGFGASKVFNLTKKAIGAKAGAQAVKLVRPTVIAKEYDRIARNTAQGLDIPDAIKKSGNVDAIVDAHVDSIVRASAGQLSPDDVRTLARPYVQNLKTRLNASVPADFVRITDNVAVDSRVADDVRKSVNQAVVRKQADPVFQALPKDTQLKELNRLRDETALAAGSTRARTLDELSDLQVALENPEGIGNSLLLKALRAYGGTESPKRASVEALRINLRRAGEKIIPTLQKDLIAKTKQTGSVDEALDLIYAEKVPPAEYKAAWRAYFADTYGPEVITDQIIKTLEADPRFAGFTNTPITMARLLEIDKLQDLYGIIGKTRVSVLAPEAYRKRAIQRNLVKVIAEEGLRKTLAGKQLDDFAARAGRVAAPESPTIKATTQTVAEFEGRTFNVLPHEKQFFQQADEAVKALEEFATTRMPKTAAEAVALRANDMLRLRKAMAANSQYGYLIPNFTQFSEKLLKVPVLSLITIGLDDTLKAAGMAAAQSRFNPTRASIAGIRSVDGVQYSPEDLALLADRYGLGANSVDVERVGRLTEDMLDAAARYGGQGVAGRVADLANPATISIYAQAARSVEEGYRRAVFFSQLKAGKTPREAAELARRSQLDFTSMHPAVQKQLTAYMSSAANTYGFWTEAASALARNPGKAVLVTNVINQRARQQNPYLDQQDAYLKGMLKIPVDSEKDYFLFKNPITDPFEEVLAASAVLNNTLDADFGKALERAGKSFGVDSDFVAGVEGWFPGRVDYKATEDALQTLPEEEKQYYKLLLISQSLPTEQRQWLLNKLAPEFQKPPVQFRDVLDESGLSWTQQPPEGLNYVQLEPLVGDIPRYQAYKMSRRGRDFVKSLKALDVVPIAPVYPIFDLATDLMALPKLNSTYGEGDIDARAMLGEGYAPGAALLFDLPATAPTAEPLRIERQLRAAEANR